MNAVLNLGKYLFALPFLMFGLFHFMSADAMAPMAFNQPVLVYLSGLGLVAAAVNIQGMPTFDAIGEVWQNPVIGFLHAGAKDVERANGVRVRGTINDCIMC